MLVEGRLKFGYCRSTIFVLICNRKIWSRSFLEEILLKKATAFNRTNVELKSSFPLRLRSATETFNRTNVELKYYYAEVTNTVAVAFNRTNVELKYNSRYSGESQSIPL